MSSGNRKCHYSGRILIPKYHNILKNVSNLTKNIFHFIYRYSNKGHLLSFMRLTYSSCCYAWRCCYAWSDPGAAQDQAQILGERDSNPPRDPDLLPETRPEVELQEERHTTEVGNATLPMTFMYSSSSMSFCSYQRVKRAEGGVEVTIRPCSTRMEMTE